MPQDRDGRVIRVVLADDHVLLREGTRELLERESDLAVVGEAGDGREAMAQVERHRPDVVLLDIAMPGMGGIEATREIKARFPRIAVLVLTNYNDQQYVIELLEAGAAGYLLKDVGHRDLIEAIRAVHAGESVLHPAVTRPVLERLRAGGKLPSAHVTGESVLTEREREVLRAAATGASNKQIGRELAIGARTVQTHLANVFEKLGVASRTEAVIEGLRHGLIELDDLG